MNPTLRRLIDSYREGREYSSSRGLFSSTASTERESIVSQSETTGKSLSLLETIFYSLGVYSSDF